MVALPGTLKLFAMAGVTTGALAFVPRSAKASDHWSVRLAVPFLTMHARIYVAPAPVYVPAPVYTPPATPCSPAPAYSTPAPVYVPAPVYSPPPVYVPAPVYVAPPVSCEPPVLSDRHGHRGHLRDWHL